MRMKIQKFLPFVFLVFIGLNAQGFETKKTLNAVMVSEAPKIDGILDENIWSSAIPSSDFVQYSPFNGDPASFRTVVRVVYDQSALYIAAMMYDPYPDSIYTELGPRDSDRNLNADHFSFDINPFNDGVNGMTFKVSASGVKTDKMRTSTGRHGSDISWDVVWQSAVNINSQGWSAEIKIPYSAIRFPKSDVQLWGVNFWREIRRKREWSTWNYVDNEVGNPFNYLGELGGIESIEPPLRLSFTPYLSGYLENYSETGNWASFYNGGMDLKYGINESFTLDLTLIPDFGQIQSDDIILNLTPFEVKYNEKRPFFTEGTELFSKGGIFYSRRVGSRPRKYLRSYQIDPSEKILENPLESKLINATKVSGRTKSGLGIGVFNGMTATMYAEIEDSTGGTRKEMTQPFTNYNMIVLDQSLKNNSYFSLVNTNVWRDAPKDEDFYTANVTGTDFKFLNKNNMYSVSGQAALTQKYYDSLDTDLGYRVNLNMGKTGGVYRAEYQTEIISDTYDPNDMGYERSQNEISHEVQLSYNIFRPVGSIQSSRNSLEIEYLSLYKPTKFSTLKISLSSFTTFMNYWTIRPEIEYTPLGINDFYEPRVEGRSYYRYPGLFFSGWVSTDRRKDLHARINFGFAKNTSPYNQYRYGFGISPRFRVNDRLQFTLETRYSKSLQDIGHVDSSNPDSIIFGMRDKHTINNTIETSFIFTNRMHLSFRLRHYWSKIDYNEEFFLLKEDGYLESNDYVTENEDINFNTFNIDMAYVWRFAPGSEMSVVWKNSIYSSDDVLIDNYFDNLHNVLQSPQINSFSIKILYYLDYQYLKRKS